MDVITIIGGSVLNIFLIMWVVYAVVAILLILRGNL